MFASSFANIELTPLGTDHIILPPVPHAQVDDFFPVKKNYLSFVTLATWESVEMFFFKIFILKHSYDHFLFVHLLAD